MRYRKGCIYEEYTYKRYVRGVGMYLRRRFVAEIQVAGKEVPMSEHESYQH